MLTIILLLYNFEPTFLPDTWTLITSIIGIASAAGTIVAAFATLQAAKAAKALKSPRNPWKHQSVHLTRYFKRHRTLNRRSNFESRYALLLAQHDNYHRQVCDYIDAWRKENAKEAKLILNDEDKKPLMNFSILVC